MKKMHCAWVGALSPVVMTTFLCFIRLNGHALTIRSGAHKGGRGWNAGYTLDARGGTIVWEPKGSSLWCGEDPYRQSRN